MSRDIAELLEKQRLFEGLSARLRGKLADTASLIDLRGGATLFDVGAPPDALYILVTGRLRCELAQGRYSELGAGEAVGELSVLADQPQSYRVVALRDAQLIRIERDALLRTLMRHPQSLLLLGRAEFKRISAHGTADSSGLHTRISNIAVLQTRAGRGSADAVRRLAEALKHWGSVKVVNEAAVDSVLGEGAAVMPYAHNQANRELVRHLNELETDTDFLIYTASGEAPTWWRRCLRQADHVVLTTEADDVFEPNLPLLRELKSQQLQVPVSMLLRHRPTTGLSTPQPWVAGLGCDGHYHWHESRQEDIEALARQLLGDANGLVLGGGGARGFAHIGLIRALDELSIPVDLYGGSSMGAFIAALRANGLSALEIMREMRASFVDQNYLNDYMLPRVALIRGKRFLRRMKEVFGHQRIEDLPAPFFCVTTNLTKGSCQVHRDGELWMWIAASMAVPGVAPPVAWNGDFVCDGAVINALPTDIMREMGRGRVIGSSVSSEGMISAPGIAGPDPAALLHWDLDIPRPSLFDILFRTATLTSESGNARRAEMADVYFRMPVSNIGMFQWDDMDALVRAGYEYAMKTLPGVRDELMPK